MGLTSSMKSISATRRQSGAVSIFSVIIAALLLSVITVSFIRVMTNEQQQASNNDLSQSAYDSALSGTEDAKRALLRYATICKTSTETTCKNLADKINSDTCNEVVRLGNVIGSDSENKDGKVSGTYGEILIRQSEDDERLDQAYTCVKADLNTPDYVGKLSANESKLIPLKTDPASPNPTFTTVTLQWFTSEDVKSDTKVVNLQPPAATLPLLSQEDWGETRPPLMRTQLMQVGKNFTLDSFDNNTSTQSNANTMFLYPIGTTGSTSSISGNWTFLNRDVRRSGSIAPLGNNCKGSVKNGGYACTARLNLPEPIGNTAGDNTRGDAYLRLTALYNTTHFRVTLGGGSEFHAVQPSIDSTGRANEFFRRIESRVDLENTNFPFPEAAVDITNSLCKAFVITDQEADYSNSCSL